MSAAISLPAVAGTAPELAWYVYAVTAGDQAAPAVTGVLPETAVEALACGPVSVLVSRVARGLFDQADASNRTADPDWMAQRIAAHHTVVAVAGACLPMGFGTLFSTLDRLRDWLEPRVPVLEAALRQAAEQSEWALSMQEDAAGLAAWLDRTDPALCRMADTMANASEGIAFLMSRRLEKARAAARIALINEVATTVADFIAEAGFGALAEPPRGGLPAWTVLVPHRAWDGLQFTMDVLADRLPPALPLRLTGPWPAYAFARTVLSQEAANG